MFTNGLQSAVRQVMGKKSASPEDIMSNAIFQVRWADVTKNRSDELIEEALKTRIAAGASCHDEDKFLVKTGKLHSLFR